MPAKPSQMPAELYQIDLVCSDRDLCQVLQPQDIWDALSMPSYKSSNITGQEQHQTHVHCWEHISKVQIHQYNVMQRASDDPYQFITCIFVVFMYMYLCMVLCMYVCLHVMQPWTIYLLLRRFINTRSILWGPSVKCNWSKNLVVLKA